MDELIQLDALGTNGAYRARNRQVIPDVAGTPIAELSLVPNLFVQRTMSALHKAHTMPADERAAALTRAGQAFATATINGLPVDHYQHHVSRVSGMPLSIVRSATEAIAHAAAEAYRTTQYARPERAVTHWKDPLTRNGNAVWARRGDVFAVHASGNHPGVNGLWLEALAVGYRVAVRPSRREPFTSHRLITALREAGFGDDQVVLLPTDYTAADEIIRGADLAMVYGGDDVMNKYAKSGNILPQGPGRSKILVTGDNWSDHIDTIVASVSHQGGTACINCTAVFVEGDPTPVAQALAERMGAILSLPPEDEKAILPVQPLKTAKTMEKYLLSRVGDAKIWLGANGIADELGDGSAVMRPAVFQVNRSDSQQTSCEMGFPCVWVAPWSPDDGIEPLKDTLVLTAITEDEELVDRLVNEPTIRNVYVGDFPTYWLVPGIPHDSYLAEFLMRTKAVIRG